MATTGEDVAVHETVEPVDGEVAALPVYLDAVTVGLVVKKCGDPAVVFVITNSDSYDAWACAYNSCAELANYLIVQTSKPDATKSCLKLPLLKGKPAAHIEAQTLSLARSTEYVRVRLAAE